MNYNLVTDHPTDLIATGLSCITKAIEDFKRYRLTIPETHQEKLDYLIWIVKLMACKKMIESLTE